jgi:membrane-associated phospholipid phosphatase
MIERAASPGAGRPMDTLFAAYAVVSGVALPVPGRPSAWPVLAALHAVAAWVGFRGPGVRRLLAALAAAAPRATRVIADWYPLGLVPLLYLELAPLNRAIWNGHYFDDIVLGWEQSIFGGQPSRSLAVAAPILALSELLHGAYLSYYLIIYGPPIILWLRKRHADFRAGMFALMLAFFAHYVFFIFFPVQGPRYLFPAPAGPIARGYLYGFAHGVLEAGSSQGAAFPSSHVGVAMAQTIIAFRLLPRIAPLLTLMTVLLAVGAVYGGFHYATDAIAGAILGTIVALAGLRLYARLRPDLMSPSAP